MSKVATVTYQKGDKYIVVNESDVKDGFPLNDSIKEKLKDYKALTAKQVLALNKKSEKSKEK